MRYDEIETPVGPLLVAADDAGLRRIHFQSGREPLPPDPAWTRDRSPFEALARSSRVLRPRAPGLRPAARAGGHALQLETWRALAAIPTGRRSPTRSWLAGRAPAAVRAVGAANGRNPLPIVIPCHRVIGKDGALTGFGGGIGTKRALLESRRPCVAPGDSSA